MGSTARLVGTVKSGLLMVVSVVLMSTALHFATAQQPAPANPHPSGTAIAPPGTDEVAYCSKCHTSGCPMPHVEHAAVVWPVNGRTHLANGKVTCSSCHTPGFKRRSDAFLARDQKGLCSPCHYGSHALPNAHPFGTPCQSCHTAPKASLVAASVAAKGMVTSINGECLRCHYDGPITHPVGVKIGRAHV